MQVEQVGAHGGREAYFLDVPGFERWPSRLELESSRFMLLLLVDARKVPDEVILAAAGRCLEQGAVSVSVWGPDCERVHDRFDDARESLPVPSENDVIVTSWHEGESLEDAVFFALVAASPTEGFQEGAATLLVASVGRPDVSARARKLVANAASL